MILCLDLGNSHLFGGVFDNKELIFRFRYPTSATNTSDQLGLFFKQVLRENHIDTNAIKAIVLCSVVPAMDYSITSACIKYFSIAPLHLKAGIKTGVKLLVKNPLEVGADRIATTVAATHQFPNRNILLVDFGTATTVSVISKECAFLGGTIMPGLKTAGNALCQHTNQLPNVDIIQMDKALGKCTQTNIQSGLYFGQLGAIKEIITRITEEAFSDSEPVTLGTGGFAYLFKEARLFDVLLPDLVLHGLYQVACKNGLI
ncbi:MAG: hypothetical protein K0R12_631 [Gammaproteobacteria bacterium]|nr:hypothetical protein [Gammaproteobacteria bacterium]